MQLLCVYLNWFRCNSLLKCVSQLEIAKKSIKTPILASKVIQGHWIRWQSRASVHSGFYPQNLKSKSGPSSPIFGLMFPHFRAQPFPPPLRAPFFSCLPSMALSDPFPSPFSLLCFPMLYLPFPLRSLLPFSFLHLLFPEGPHPQLEGLTSQVL